MDRKQLFFVLTGLTAGALGGALGRHATITDEPVKGTSQIVTWTKTIHQGLGPVMAMGRAQIDVTVCNEMRGKGRPCNAQLMDFNTVHSNKRTVHRADQENVRVPVRRNQSYDSWIKSRLRALCSEVDDVYGDGTCDAETVDFVIRDISTDGTPRSKVELMFPVFCTGTPLPIDPDASVEPDA